VKFTGGFYAKGKNFNTKAAKNFSLQHQIIKILILKSYVLRRRELSAVGNRNYKYTEKLKYERQI
jgi:hypothetical protein